MYSFEDILIRYNRFIDERGWRQYQHPKDLALSVSIEAAEILEHVQWKTDGEVERHLADHREELGDEIVDFLLYLLQLAHVSDIDLASAIDRKMKKNEEKYPASEVQGKHSNKYN